MASFHASYLSPQPKDAQPCDLPFGLTWQELQPALPGFSLQAGIKAHAFVSYQKQGVSGGNNSCILTIRYPAEENAERTETIFIKHTQGPDKVEACKYQFLAEHGVPVPRLLGVIPSGESETIILEFLPTIGIDFSSASEVNSLLELAASINAILTPPDPSRAQLAGLPQDQFDEMVRHALREIENAQVQSAAAHRLDPEHWLTAYKTAHKVMEITPQALNHNQFYFQQVGWAQRGPGRQLVSFDLETLDLSPRFSDIATILYALSLYSGRDQIELFQFYLDTLSRLTRTNFNLEQALREFRFTRICYACESLPWLVSEAKRPEDLLTLHEITTLWDDITSLDL